MDTYLHLFERALEQTPALVVVGVMLYLFIKAGERFMNKLIGVHTELKELYVETMTEYKNSINLLTKAVHDLDMIARMLYAKETGGNMWLPPNEPPKE